MCFNTSFSQCLKLRHTELLLSYDSAPHNIRLRKVLCVAMSLQFRHRRLPKKPFFKWCHRLKIFLNHQQTILRVWCYVRTFSNHSIWIRTSTASLSVCVWLERERERERNMFLHRKRDRSLSISGYRIHRRTYACVARIFNFGTLHISFTPKSATPTTLQSVRVTAPLCTVFHILF